MGGEVLIVTMTTRSVPRAWPAWSNVTVTPPGTEKDHSENDQRQGLDDPLTVLNLNFWVCNQYENVSFPPHHSGLALDTILGSPIHLTNRSLEGKKPNKLAKTHNTFFSGNCLFSANTFPKLIAKYKAILLLL